MQRFSPTKLERLREAAELPRSAIAYATRRSEQSVYLWERGRATPSVGSLQVIAEYLGCEVADFFEAVDDA